MADTMLLRCLAGLLIANSHIEGYYPIRQLAADGLVGNSLFFLLSGLGLSLSRRRTQRPFVQWYARRAGRILPSVCLIVLVFDFLGRAGWRSWTVADYVSRFGWGAGYHFIEQILVFYVLFYWLQKLGRPGVFPALLAGLFLPYLALPFVGRSDLSFHGFHWLYYFQVMLLGGWLADRPDLARPGDRRDALYLAAVFAAYVALRLAVPAAGSGGWFFLPFLPVFPLVVLLLRLARSAWVGEVLMTRGWVAPVVGLIGGASLELYLVHFHVIPIRLLASLPFPLNVVSFLIVSVALAVLCNRVIAALRGLATSAWTGGRATVLDPPPA